jgi:hypothetical protein
MVVHIRAIPNQPTPRYWLYLFTFAILGLLPLVLGRFAILIWAIFIIARLLPILLILGYSSYRLWGYASLLRYVLTITLLFSASFGSDVLYIAYALDAPENLGPETGL